MEYYATTVYPVVLAASAVLALAGVASLVVVRAHRVLTWVVTGIYVVVGAHLVAVVAGLLSGPDVDLVITAGYLLASLGLLPLLGIARLGAPEAKRADVDPDRPVLQPDQIARVDGAVAVAVAIALAVVSWRLTEVFGAAS